MVAHRVRDAGVAGSNPVIPIFCALEAKKDLFEFFVCMKILSVNHNTYKKTTYKNSAVPNTIKDNKNYSSDVLVNNYSYGQACVSFGHSKDISTVCKKFKDCIKIVFSDVDGTISPHSDLISEKTIKAIEFLHSKKVPVILTTARCYKDTLPIIEQIKHKPDYTIVLQGGEIIDKKGRAIMKNEISHDCGKKLLKWFHSLKQKDDRLNLILYFNNEAYSLSDFKFPWKARCQVIKAPSYETFFRSKDTLQKAVLCRTGAKEKAFDPGTVISAFENSGIDELSMKTSGSSGFFEIQNKSVSKDKAINYLLKKFKIDSKYAACVGDSENDIEMLDFIRQNNGLAVAMGNASDNVAAHADAITTGVREDGFYNMIKNLYSNFE